MIGVINIIKLTKMSSLTSNNSHLDLTQKHP